MRLFLAILPPRPIQESLCAIARDPRLSLFPLRITPQAQIHLTLKFLSQVNEGKEKMLEERVGEGVKNIDRFGLTLEEIRFKQRTRGDSYLWVVPETEPRLGTLKETLDQALAPLGFPERQPFTPHLLLARLRRQDHRSHEKALAQTVSELEFTALTFRVTSILLFQSQLDQKGAKHTVLRRFPLHRIASGAESRPDSRSRVSSNFDREGKIDKN